MALAVAIRMADASSGISEPLGRRTERVVPLMDAEVSSTTTASREVSAASVDTGSQLASKVMSVRTGSRKFQRSLGLLCQPVRR